MEWYWIVLIVVGGLAVLYLLLTVVIAKAVLKMAATPVAHTIDEARAYQAEYEGINFDDYDNNWRKQEFEVEGINGIIRGEVIFNDTPTPRNKVAVICHGHTWNRINSLKYSKAFFDKGYNIVIYDHAYFGLSDGKFTTLGDNERHDLNEVLNYVRETFGDDAIVALHGESMGAATVLCELELRSDIDFVVADCPFSDTMKYYRELCTHLTHLPSFPIVDIANAMSKRKYKYDFKTVNPINGVKNNPTPICFIHGADDKFIYPHHSKWMYEASGNPLSELHIFEGAAHARSHKQDKELYNKIVGDFIDKIETSLEIYEKTKQNLAS